MAPKAPADANLAFLYLCLQKSDYKIVSHFLSVNKCEQASIASRLEITLLPYLKQNSAHYTL